MILKRVGSMVPIRSLGADPYEFSKTAACFLKKVNKIL